MNNLPTQYTSQNQENEFEADSMLAEEEKARKKLARKRLFWVLVSIAIVLLGVLCFEIVDILQ